MRFSTNVCSICRKFDNFWEVWLNFCKVWQDFGQFGEWVGELESLPKLYKEVCPTLETFARSLDRLSKLLKFHQDKHWTVRPRLLTLWKRLLPNFWTVCQIPGEFCLNFGKFCPRLENYLNSGKFGRALERVLNLDIENLQF